MQVMENLKLRSLSKISSSQDDVRLIQAVQRMITRGHDYPSASLCTPLYPSLRLYTPVYPNVPIHSDPI